MRFNEKILGLFFIGLGVVGLLSRGLPFLQAASQGNVKPQSASQTVSPVVATRQPCRVLTVYDGDTLGCDFNEDGRIQRPKEEVRLLGVDTPEMHYSKKNRTYGAEHPTDEPFAPEASHWLNAQVRGKTVYLEFDQRHRDKYQRTLAYVYAKPTDQRSLNAEELAQGYATLLFLGKNRLHEAEFEAIEAQARQEKRGLWGNRGNRQ